MSEEQSKTPPALFSFLGFSLISAIWALYLVQVHNDAVAQQLDPSLLCGPEGGCGAVLASDWSTIFGIAVSAPAVPMYALLFVMGLQVCRTNSLAKESLPLVVLCLAVCCLVLFAIPYDFLC